MSSPYWTDRSLRDFKAPDLSNAIAVLPIAAIEQHGPHLPPRAPRFVDTVCDGFSDHVENSMNSPRFATAPPALKSWLHDKFLTNGLQRSPLWLSRRVGIVTSSRYAAGADTNVNRVTKDLVNAQSSGPQAIINEQMTGPETADMRLGSEQEPLHWEALLPKLSIAVDFSFYSPPMVMCKDG